MKPILYHILLSLFIIVKETEEENITEEKRLMYVVNFSERWGIRLECVGALRCRLRLWCASTESEM